MLMHVLTLANTGLLRTVWNDWHFGFEGEKERAKLSYGCSI